MTKGGIYLNIEESTYKISKYGLTFYFSSKFYMEKFEENVEKYVETESLKLKNKYLTDCYFEKYLAVSYYRKIEKRGFKIELEGKERIITKFTSFKCDII